jgi:hypothetical protein
MRGRSSQVAGELRCEPWQSMSYSMRHFVFFILLAGAALAAEPKGPFYSPITGFSDAFLPLLTGFEKASVETTLRGFIARADSFPGYRNSDVEPSEYGLYLNVAVRDAEEVNGLSDRTEQKGAVTHRLVQIPPPKGGDQAIVIQFDYGGKASAETIKAIDSCIAGIVKFAGRPVTP